MSTVINTNLAALNSHRSLKVVGEDASKASEKLSSGMRINRAADDAAGLAISEKMRNQIRGLNQASRNSQDGISMMQTAEGALQETHEMLKRMRELVVQAANDTNTSGDRAKIATELSQLASEIDETADKTEFNTLKLIDSTHTFTLQIGANSGQSMSVGLQGMTITGLSLGTFQTAVGGTFSAATSATISGYLKDLDDAIEVVSTQRATLGSQQNRLEHTIKNLDTTSENLSASESRIRDTDMAKEMMSFTKSNVLQQAATNMLAQANQAPNNILTLLR